MIAIIALTPGQTFLGPREVTLINGGYDRALACFSETKPRECEYQLITTSMMPLWPCDLVATVVNDNISVLLHLVRRSA